MITDKPWLEPAWKLFGDSIAHQRLAHALLVQGLSGMGKSLLAREMAARLLCDQQADQACGSCRSCQLFKGGAHPDYFFVSREPNPKTGKMRQEIIIDQVRKLIGSLQLTTSISQSKVAIIDPAECMNPNAANALLKTLEEPPGPVYLLLVCSDPSRLPVTIRSRCQSITVPPASSRQSLAWLAGQGFSDAAEAGSALEMAAGSPLRALQALQQGNVDAGREIQQKLAALLQGTTAASQVAASLADGDTDSTWLALSQCMAAAMRAVSCGNGPEWLASDVIPDARRVSELQRLADQNRKLVSTPVRQDLLIHDWLIKWTRVAVPFAA